MKTAKLIRQFVERELLDGVWLPEDPLAAGLLDSVALVELTLFLECRFDLVFVEEELVPENLGSIDALAALVDAKRREAAP